MIYSQFRRTSAAFGALTMTMALTTPGCGQAQEAAPESAATPAAAASPRVGAWRNKSKSIRVTWTWTRTGPGAADIAATIATTSDGRTLSVKAMPEAGTTIVGGEAVKEVDEPKRETPATLSFSVVYPPGTPVRVPLHIDFDVRVGKKVYSVALLIDPEGPGAPARAETPGSVSSPLGVPEKATGGEMERR